MSLRERLNNEVEISPIIDEKFLVYTMQMGMLLVSTKNYSVYDVEKIDSLRFKSDPEGLLLDNNVPRILIPMTLAMNNLTRLSRYGDVNIKFKLVNEEDVGTLLRVMGEL